MKTASRQSLCLDRFAQDHGTRWYLAVLQRPDLKGFFCFLVISMRTGSVVAGHSPFETLDSDSEISQKQQFICGHRLRHCVYLAAMSLPPHLAPSPDARIGPPPILANYKSKGQF